MEQKEPPRVWEEGEIPNEEEECFEKHDFERQKETPIGAGGFGEIYVACREANCNFVIKRTILEQDTPEDRALAEREGYFLQRLNSITLDGQRITPRMFDQWFCEYPNPYRTDQKLLAHYLAMDRYDGDMFRLGQNQAEEYQRLHKRLPVFPLQFVKQNAAGNLEVYTTTSLKPTLLFSFRQLRRMFRIAALLSELHIVHADLKAENYLQRNLAGRGEEIVVSDFGFAGEYTRYVPMMGFTANRPVSCPTDLFRYRDRYATAIEWMNEFQLEAELTAYTTTWVTLPQGWGEIALFGGLTLPDHARQALGRACRSYGALYPQMQATLATTAQQQGVYLLQVDVADILPKRSGEKKLSARLLAPPLPLSQEEEEEMEEEAQSPLNTSVSPALRQYMDLFPQSPT